MFAHFTHNCTFGKWNPLRLRLLIFCVRMNVFHTAVCPFDEDIGALCVWGEVHKNWIWDEKGIYFQLLPQIF